MNKLENGSQELKPDTYSEEWRHACEVRWLTKQSLEVRRKVLGLIADARGVKEQERIKAGLIQLWKNK